MSTIEGRLTLTADDLDRGQRDVPFSWVWRYGWLGWLLTLLATVPQLLDGPMKGSTLFTAMMAGALLLLQGNRFATWWRRKLAALRDDRRHVSYRFDEQGVSITTPVSNHSLAYGLLQHYVDGDSAFLLYIEPSDAPQIIPKRAFSDEQLGRIRRWLADHVVSQPQRGAWVIALGVFMLVIATLAGLFIWNLLRSSH